MNPQQLPANYLDQIASPVASRKSLFKGPGLLIAIGLALVVVMLIVVLIVNIVTGTKKEPWEVLSVQLASTEKIAASATNNIKSSQLRSLNSEIRLFVTNTTRDIKNPMLLAKVDTKKIPASVTTAASADPALARLETARLNAAYDRAYAREMAYQLTLVMTQLRKLYATSGDASTKKLLETAYKSLESTHASLSNFSTTN